MNCFDCEYSESRYNVLGNQGLVYCTKYQTYMGFDSSCPDYRESQE